MESITAAIMEVTSQTRRRYCKRNCRESYVLIIKKLGLKQNLKR